MVSKGCLYIRLGLLWVSEVHLHIRQHQPCSHMILCSLESTLLICADILMEFITPVFNLALRFT